MDGGDDRLILSDPARHREGAWDSSHPAPTTGGSRSGPARRPTYAGRMLDVHTRVTRRSGGGGGDADAGGPGGDGPSPAPLDGAPAPSSPSTWRRVRPAVTVLGGLALTLLLAVVVTVLLDASAWPHPVNALRNRTFDSPALVPSVAVVWVFVLLVVALLGRLWTGMGVVSALTVLVGLVNVTKLELRNDPVYPSDVVFLRQPSFLLEMVSKAQLVRGAVALVAVVLLAAAVGWVVGKFFPRLTMNATRRRRRGVVLARVLVVVVCMGMLHVAGNFNERGNQWRAAFDSTGMRWRAWDQRVNYQQNGFVSGLLYNMHVDAMTEPDGYSEAAVRRVVQRYQAEAARMNQGRTGSLEDTNVVIVLSESFSQPAWLDGVSWPENLIPRTTATMEQTVSGRMLAPGIGSGTANTEYELLTGQSLSQLSPQLTTPYEQLVSNYDRFPSAVEWFRRHGHEPVAIHPFSPRMYSRPEVYDAFGFDRFVSKDQMKNTKRGGGRFIDDRSAFAEVLDQIRDTDKPVLAHLVTMQNHMPYGGQYDDPIPPTSGLSGEYARQAGAYARGISRTDEALDELLTQLKASPEPTTVIFYGDHVPPQVYPQSLLDREGPLRSHQTPFLIWSNREQLRHTDLPTTSPTQFLPMMFNAMDVPVPPWYALLTDLGGQVPAMDAGITVGADGERVRVADLGPEAKRVLRDYRLIQYDLSVGERWSEKAMFGDAPAR